MSGRSISPKSNYAANAHGEFRRNHQDPVQTSTLQGHMAHRSPCQAHSSVTHGPLAHRRHPPNYGSEGYKFRSTIAVPLHEQLCAIWQHCNQTVGHHITLASNEADDISRTQTRHRRGLHLQLASVHDEGKHAAPPTGEPCRFPREIAFGGWDAQIQTPTVSDPIVSDRGACMTPTCSEAKFNPQP